MLRGRIDKSGIADNDPLMGDTIKDPVTVQLMQYGFAIAQSVVHDKQYNDASQRGESNKRMPCKQNVFKLMGNFASQVSANLPAAPIPACSVKRGGCGVVTYKLQSCTTKARPHLA